jgi:membrane protease YdiL (CAAX protease family)
MREKSVDHDPRDRPFARAPAIALGLFFILTFTLTWIVWVPRALASQGIIHSDLAVLLGRGWTHAPALAAFLFVAVVQGRRAVANLGRRLLQWRIGWGWYAVIVAVPLMIGAGTALIYAILGGRFNDGLPTAFELPLLLVPLMIAIRILTDGLGEEVAWRGVALPGLLKQMNGVTASLILGVIWAVWHLPLLFTKGSTMAGNSVLLLFALLPAQAVFYTWIYQHTRGSVFAAALLHGLIGLLSVAAPVAEASGRPELIRVLLWWITGGALVAVYGRNLNSRSSRLPRRLA